MDLSSSWAFLSPFTFALNPKVSQHFDYGLKHKFAIKRIFTLFFINIVVESVWLWRISEAITGEGVTNLSWKPKLLFWIMCPVSFWFFFFTEGSFTDFNISLASFLFLHASVRLTSGQTPKASNFPFPINWYFNLQYIFPLWSRSRKRYTHKWSAWASWFDILYKIILKCVKTLPSSVITITKWL